MSYNFRDDTAQMPRVRVGGGGNVGEDKAMKMLQRVWASFHQDQRQNPDGKVLISDELLSSLSSYEEASDDERVRLFVKLAREVYEQGRHVGFSAGYEQRVVHEREYAEERAAVRRELPDPDCYYY